MKNRDNAPLSDRERAYFGPRTNKVPGSVDWCWQTILLMQRRWRLKTLDEVGFQALLDELSEHEAWNIVPAGQPYGSLDALLQAEIGCNEEEARERFVTQPYPKRGERPGLRKLRNLTQGDRARHNGICRRSQTKLDYLAGHRKDLLDEVQRGAMSIDFAYQHAKGKIPETPFEALLRAWRLVSREERVRFVREMLTEEERTELADELSAIETREG